jgi:hypothetical protein
MKNYSQNDPRWATDRHGTRRYYIKTTGCTITALASFLTHFGIDETPKTVNQKLTKFNGYAKGNLIIWAKINDIWPEVEWIKRGYVYKNSEVLDNLPCLVEVKAPQAVGGKHWVLYIGDKKLMDPLDGKIKSTRVYTPTGYSIINHKKSMTDGQKIIKLPDEKFEELVTKATIYDKFLKLGFKDLNDINELKAKNEAITTKYREAKKDFKKFENKALVEAEAQRKTISELESLLAEFKEEGTGKKAEVKELNELIEKIADLLKTSTKSGEIIGEITKLLEQNDNFRSNLTQAEKKYKLLKDEKNQEIAQLRAELVKLKEHAQRLEQRIDDLKKDEKNQEIVQLRAELAKLKEYTQRLEQRIDDLKKDDKNLWDILKSIFKK